jgi:hypothetical protein
MGVVYVILLIAKRRGKKNEVVGVINIKENQSDLILTLSII